MPSQLKSRSFSAIIILICAFISYSTLTPQIEIQISETANENHQRTPSNMNGKSLITTVGKIPFASRLTDYIDALGVSQHGAGHSGANEGLATFNNKLLASNSCFSELATRFYDEIKILDIERYINTQSLSRPSLVDKLDETTSPKAGFLWELALKHSNGDKNLALSLIGICGHDDAISVPTNLSTYIDPIISAKKNKLWHRLQLVTAMESQKPFSEFFRNYLFNPGCPAKFSSMFYPGSLDRTADIPNDLKNSIISVQAPTLGGSAIPAKYYHVLAGAISTCLMYQDGVPPLIAFEIHTRAINAYRSKTICSSTSFDAYRGELLSQVGPISASELTGFMEKYKNNELNCLKEQPSQKINLLCSIVTEKEAYENLSEDLFLKRMQTSLARADAAWLYLNSSIYQKSKSCESIDINSSVERSINAITSLNCPSSWTHERCKNAMKPLDSWSVDFKWTRNQHQQGELFARRNCQKIPTNHDRLENACSALEKIKF